MWLTRVVRGMLAARRGDTADPLELAPEEQALTLKVLFNFCFRFGQGLPFNLKDIFFHCLNLWQSVDDVGAGGGVVGRGARQGHLG